MVEKGITCVHIQYNRGTDFELLQTIWNPLPVTHTGAAPDKVVAVVGKGLTFDSGGYNLKAGPGSMIEMMKFGESGFEFRNNHADVL